MAGITLEIPQHIWELAQKHFGLKKPNAQMRLLIEQCLFDDGAFARKAVWANGGTKPPPPAQPVAELRSPWGSSDESIRLDDEVRELLGQKMGADFSPPKPLPIKPPPPPPPNGPQLRPYWSNPLQIADNIHKAVAAFIFNGPDFWQPQFFPNGTQPEKDLEEMIDILESIEGQEYADLTGQQQNFLRLVAHVHRIWWKATH